MSVKSEIRSFLNQPDNAYGEFVPLADRGGALLWDWLTVPAGELLQDEYRLMAVVPYGREQLLRTNLLLPGALPLPQGFIVQSIHCFYGLLTESADLAAFRESYTLRFWILEKYFYEAPLIAIPDLGAFLPDSPLPWPAGSPEPPGTLPVGFERYIPPGASFGITLRGKGFRLRSDLRFLPLLKGLLDRAVQ